MTDTTLFANRQEALETFARHVSQHKVEFYQQYGFDLVMGEREGSFFHDVDGRRFLNAHCNGGVFNMGHRHPRLRKALVEATERWGIGNHHLISEPRALLAQQLASLLPGDLDQVVFGVSGGEASDTALKMARGLTGRTGVLSANGGYHGHTGLAMAAGDARYREPFGPQLPGFSQVPFGDLDALDAALDDQIAAVILEPIPATLGMVIPPAGYLEGVRRLCDARGAMLILDEVQTGLGRTGKLWAHEHYDIVPDFVILGKGLSGGLMPISATCYRTPHHKIFADDPFVHISTYGGAELACMVTLEMLAMLTEQTFLPQVNDTAALLASSLQKLQQNHANDFIEVRQLGMMIGLLFATPGHGMLMSKILLDHGMFAVYANNDRRALQFLLPLTISTEEVEQAMTILSAGLKTLQDPQMQEVAKMLSTL